MSAIDYSDPRQLAEKAEELDQRGDEEVRALSEGMTRALSWCLEAKTLAEVGYRTNIVAYVLYPQLINGVSLESIGKQLGHGRSGVNRHSQQFSKIVGIRGQLQKTDAQCAEQSRKWRLAHGSAC